MKLFVAIDSFKGSLSSASACRIAKRAGKAFPAKSGRKAQSPAEENERVQFLTAENAPEPQPLTAEAEKNSFPVIVDAVPVGDGGEGTKRAFAYQTSAQKKAAVITAKNGRKKQACYLVAGGTAYLDAADCCGISVENRKEDALLSFTSYGLGELLSLAAKDDDVTELCVGLGGTGTADGGAGCLAALGAEFFDAYGRKTGYLPSDLPYVKRCDFSALVSALNGKKLTVLCDTEAPLSGENGAVALFAAQKGASAGGKRFLEDALAGFSSCALREVCRQKTLLCTEKQGNVPQKSKYALPESTTEFPSAKSENFPGKGTGAAGGLGFALLSVLGGEYKNGLSELFLRQDYEAKLQHADAVISGEGWIDATSFTGKAVGKIAALCKKHDKPLYLVAGGISPDVVLPETVKSVFLLTALCQNVFECMSRAEELFERCLRDALRAAAADFGDGADADPA